MASYELEQAPEYVALSYTWGSATQALEEAWYLSDSSDTSSFDYSAAEERLGLRHADRSEDEDDDPDRPQIVCDERMLRVNQNLFDALKELRKSQDQSFYWIDAVCINQARHPGNTGNTEKPAQIRQMGRIYQRASRIVIWLGRPCGRLDDFVWVSEELSRHFWSNETGQLSLTQRPLLWQHLNDPQLARRLGLKGPEDLLKRVRNFVLFCNKRAWFKRAWTVQEANSSTTETEMLCGSTRISYPMACFMGYLIEHGVWHQDVNDTRPGRNKARFRRVNLANRMAIQNHYTPISGEMSNSRTLDRIRYIFGCEIDGEHAIAALAYMIFQTMYFECTNPRDKVYAVLAFLQPLLQDSIQVSILVDYHRSVKEIYTAFAKAVLDVTPRLGLLSIAACTNDNRREGLPSWVPELRTKAKEPRDGFIQPLVNIFESNVYDAMNCTDINRLAARRVDGSQLVCQGAIFDNIANVCDASNTNILKHRQLGFLFRFIESLPLSVGGIDRIEALWRTWSGNYCCDYINSIEYKPMEDFSGTDFKYFLEQMMLERMLVFGEREDGGLALPTALESLDPSHTSRALPDPAEFGIRFLTTVVSGRLESRHNFEVQRYQTSMQHVATGRRLFLTTKGFLGMGPAAIEAGHKICFCYDSIVPLIVRDSPDADPTHETVELVGDCYLHGFMNGEVLQDQVFRNQIGDIRII